MSKHKPVKISVSQAPGEVLEIRGAKHFTLEGQEMEDSIFVKDGYFIDSSKLTDDDVHEVIEAEGHYLLPGLVDLHVHLREPGQEYKEDIASGTRSAVAGGVTSVVTMPNTNPVADQASVIAFMLKRAEDTAVARVYPTGAVSKGMKAEELSEMGLMAEAGIVAVTDDGRPVNDSDLLRKGLDYAKRFDLLLMDHCEDPTLQGDMVEGMVSWELGLRGQPGMAEAVIVARNILMAEYIDAPIHLQHISSKSSVQLIRYAKARGVKVSAETCPHYFVLTDEACRGYNTYAKVNPPLKQEDDRLAIIEGLVDGTIDAIATDHAPHDEDSKQVPFPQAANGLIGLETSIALSNTYLVEAGHLTLFQLICMMSTRPAELLNLPHGTLEPGSPADFFLFDPKEEWVWDPKTRYSKSKNSPFEGHLLKGRVQATWVAGKKVFDVRY